MSRGELDSLMGFEEVIAVTGHGRIVRVGGVSVPEAHIGALDDDARSIMPEHDRALIAYFRRHGWELETGWTGQQGDHRNNPLLHPSEYIGGRLEEHIRETPGLWVAVPVYDEGTGESTGYWAVAHRESTEGAVLKGPVRRDPAPAGYDRIGLPLEKSAR